MRVSAPTRAAGRGWTRAHKTAVVAGLVVVVMVAATLVGLRLTSAQRLADWQAACRARAGSVQTAAPHEPNPLVTESKDPTYRCRSFDGRTLSSWR
ncbi:hypothetical protein [uncultured Friedmanniella sp.]|uniref:hypothetical protein n=1 Tax=uncultured Friedmanniella sp. TaxID=335381 RepID=UPI0035CBD2B7